MHEQEGTIQLFVAAKCQKTQGQYWIEFLSTTNNSNYQYSR